MSITDIRFETCADCEAKIDLDHDGYEISVVTDEFLCESCRDSEQREASTAYFIQKGEDPQRYEVTSRFIWDEWGEDLNNYPGEPRLTRAYHSTDGWRGYYETRPTGEWREASSGWTTGGWSDAVARSKQAFNEWAQRLIEGESEPPCDMWLIFDPTSNVFSTSVGVFVPADVEDDVLTIPEF